MVQTGSSNTVNPAGAPRIKESAALRDPYTRADFVRDLEKVSKKTVQPKKP